MSDLTENESYIHIFPSDIEKMENHEASCEVYSLPMGHPDKGKTIPFYSESQVEQLRKDAEVYAQYDVLECLDKCDGLAHEENCPSINPIAAFEALRKELAQVKKERDEAIKVAELSNNLSAEIMVNNDHEIEYEYRVNSLADRIAQTKDKG